MYFQDAVSRRAHEDVSAACRTDAVHVAFNLVVGEVAGIDRLEDVVSGTPAVRRLAHIQFFPVALLDAVHHVASQSANLVLFVERRIGNRRTRSVRCVQIHT